MLMFVGVMMTLDIAGELESMCIALVVEGALGDA
jgi:hypothetical protein